MHFFNVRIKHKIKKKTVSVLKTVLSNQNNNTDIKKMSQSLYDRTDFVNSCIGTLKSFFLSSKICHLFPFRLYIVPFAEHILCNRS